MDGRRNENLHVALQALLYYDIYVYRYVTVLGGRGYCLSCGNYF